MSKASSRVKGILLDSLSNEGEPYSTIRISLKNNPAKPVKLAVTGADGRFDERLAVPGTYLIHFTSVGKSPVQKEFSISTNRKNVDLGKILIAEATENVERSGGGSAETFGKGRNRQSDV